MLYAINVTIAEPEILLLYVVVNSYPSTVAVTKSGLSEIAVIVDSTYASTNVFDRLNVLLLAPTLVIIGGNIFTIGGFGKGIIMFLENL